MKDTNLASIVVVGEVDHGKSTLLGRLLLECGHCPQDRIAKVARICAAKSLSFEPAFLLDALEEEQVHGVTIDTTRVNLTCGEWQLELIDAPGHLEFLKNMTTGASGAELALVVVAATEGVCPQTERHLGVLSLLGIESVLVAINKIDLIGYERGEFERISQDVVQKVEQYSLKCRGLVPVCALEGENLISPSAKMPWCTGLALLPQLMAAVGEPGTSADQEPLRAVVQDVYRFDGERYLVSKVSTGILNRNQNVLFSPSGKVGVIQAIERYPQVLVSAVAGDCIAITLKDQVFVERGEVVSVAEQAPKIDTEIRARLVWFSEQSFEPGRKYLLKVGTQETFCRLEAIAVGESSGLVQSGVIGGAQPDGADWECQPSRLTNGLIAEAIIHCDRPVAFDSEIPGSPIGRFVICSDRETVACGRVAADQKKTAVVSILPARFDRSAVSRELRERRQKHKGCVLWITGLSGAGKTSLARAIELELFEKSCNVVVLDADNLRQNICADLKFSRQDRAENIRRIATTAKLFLEAGAIVVVACISPYRADRESAREIIGADDFLEIFLFCPLEVCQRRDAKGLYKAFLAGNLKSMPGADVPYQPPLEPALRLDSSALSIEAELSEVVSLLEKRAFQSMDVDLSKSC